VKEKVQAYGHYAKYTDTLMKPKRTAKTDTLEQGEESKEKPKTYEKPEEIPTLKSCFEDL